MLWADTVYFQVRNKSVNSSCTITFTFGLIPLGKV